MAGSSILSKTDTNEYRLSLLSKAMIDLPKALTYFFYEAMVNNNYENKYQSYRVLIFLGR